MSSRSRSPAQALASRENGARSRGPVTPAGKARASRNALRHGLRARAVVLLDDEDAAAFEALEQALHAELAPRGRLQHELVGRIVHAAWRARRADRMESALFARQLDADGAAGGDLGTALIRDGYGPRMIDTLLRYRGSVHAELFRALGALRVLQGEAAEDAGTRPTERTRDEG